LRRSPGRDRNGRAGYLVAAFDYRGWGASDSRVILTGPPPAARPNNRFTALVQEVREVVDPSAAGGAEAGGRVVRQVFGYLAGVTSGISASR